MKLWTLWASRRLSSQIAAVVAMTVIVCALLIVLATQLWDLSEQFWLMQSLSPASRRALDALIAGRDPAYADFVDLMRVQKPLNQRAILRSNIALTIFTLVAVGMSFFVGRLLANRLGRGLENVARAARAVAEGDLGARAIPIGWSSMEERQLIDDFNTMAGALAEAERELRYSTAAIVHELRTPLTVLNGRLSGIRDGVFEAGPEQIANLLRQVEGLARIVEDLRVLSLVDSGQSKLHLEAIDLADVVRSVTGIIEPDLLQAGLSLNLDLKATPMIADQARLRQALTAVLTNTIRYAPGSGPVTIRTAIAGGLAQLIVLDRGPGLSAEAEARAFERFWRAEPSRARASGGSGLGLAVVRAIAAAHYGRARFTSRAGGGAAFEMTLPLAPPDEAAS